MILEGVIQKTLRTIIKDGLAAQGYPQIGVKQSYQPTNQGVPSTPTVFFFKVTNQRIGFQARKYTYNDGNENFDKTENYYIAATYQITALVKQDITDPNSASAFDIVDLCSAILQLSESVQTFLAAGIGVERITAIRQPYFSDDDDEFESEPSFDVILTYNQTINTSVPVADPIELEIQRV